MASNGKNAVRLAVILVIGASISGAAALAFSMSLGIGLEPDSATYLGAARAMSTGHGFAVEGRDGLYRPVTHFPPLYPAMISAIGQGGLEALDSARWLAIALIALNIILASVLTRRLAPEAGFAVPIATLLLVSSVEVYNVHSFALSEPLFTALFLAALVCLHGYFDSDRLAWLIAASLAVGLAAVARYAGLSLSVALPAAIFLFSSRPRRQRITHAVLAAAFSVVAPAAWMARNALAANSITDRSFAFHPIPAESWSAGLEAVTIWFLPTMIGSHYRIVGTVVAIVCIGILLVLFRDGKGDPNPSNATASHFALEKSLLLCCIAYAALLLTTILFFDAHTPLDRRTLFPLYMGLVILVSARTGTAIALLMPHRKTQAAVVVLAALFTASYMARSARWIRSAHAQGRGYASAEWKDSETLRWVMELGNAEIAYTNAPDAVYLLANRRLRALPRKYNPTTLSPSEGYQAVLASLIGKVVAGEAEIVFFDAITWRDYQPSRDELEIALPRSTRHPTSDGVIFRARSQAGAAEL